MILVDLSGTIPQTLTAGNWTTSLNTVKWSFPWTPTAASTDASWRGAGLKFFAVASTNDTLGGGIWIEWDPAANSGAGTHTIMVVSAATGSAIAGARKIITWGASQAMDVTPDMAAGTLTVAGAATGNGSVAFTPEAILTGSSLVIGAWGGGSGYELPSSAIGDITDGASGLAPAAAIAAATGGVPTLTPGAVTLAPAVAVAAATAGTPVVEPPPSIARVGLWHRTAVPGGWFSARLQPIGWFSRRLITVSTIAGDVLAPTSAVAAATAGAPTLAPGAATLAPSAAVAAATASTPTITGQVPALGAHAIDFQLYGLANRSASVTLTFTAGSLVLVFSGGKSSDVSVAPTSSDGRTARQIGTTHDYPDFPGYGTATYAFHSVVGGSTTITQPVTLFDENTFEVVEILNGKIVRSVAHANVANAGSGSTVTSGSVTATGPAYAVDAWWGSSPVVTPVSSLPSFSATPATGAVLDSYLVNNDGGEVQAAFAGQAITAGTSSQTWTHAPNQGAQTWRVVVQGDEVLPGATVAATAGTPTLSGSQFATPAAAIAAATAGVPTLTGTNTLTVAAAAAAATASDPTLTPGAATMAPGAAAAAATAGTPTVVPGAVAIAPISATAAATAADPTLAPGAVALASAAAAAAAAAAVPTLTPGAVTLAPSSAAAAATGGTPDLVTGGTLAPAAAAAVATGGVPGLTPSPIALAPSAATATATAGTPTLTPGAATLTPAAAVAAATAGAPVVSLPPPAVVTNLPPGVDVRLVDNRRSASLMDSRHSCDLVDNRRSCSLEEE